MLINTFAIGFTFIPFHVLRMEQRDRDLQPADAGARRSLTHRASGWCW